MTDFYSVLQRAVSTLPDKSGANRRAVYDKARKALVKQLQSFDPPLPSSEVTAQRLALEDAIRRLESDIARSARTRRTVQGAMPAAPAAGTARPQPPGAGRAPEPPAAPGAETAAPTPPEAEHPPPVARAGEHETADAADAPDTAEHEPPAAAPPPAAAEPDPDHPRAPRTDHATLQAERRARRERERAERQQQRRAQRSHPAAAEPESAAAASSEAAPKRPGRAAPGTDAAFAEAEAIDAGVSPEDVDEDAERIGADAGEAETGEAAPAGVAPHVAARRREPAGPRRSLAARVLTPLVVLVVLAGVGAAAYTQRDQILALIEPGDSGRAITGATAPPLDPESVTPKVTDRLGAPPDPEDDPDTRRVRTTRIVTTADGERVATPSADAERDAPTAAATSAPARDVTPTADDAGTSAAARILRDPSARQDDAGPQAATESLDTGPAEEAFETAALEDAAEATVPDADEPPPGEAEIEAAAVREASPDAPEGETAALGANAGSGPQVAVLYEEGAEPGARGAALSGKVSWEVTEMSVFGQAPEWVVQATATVPERGLTLNLTIRENHDDTLPASHLIELSFITPDDFPGGSIANIPGLIMKETEEERGNALLGAAAQVSSGLFWIALAKGEEDRAQNMQLLGDRAWIDIPILYENGRRAILTLQKGESGGRAVAQAFEAWERG